jgi:arylsulfatase
METCDTEFLGAAQDFIRRAHDDDQPFFVWFNTTWMHFRVHPPEHVLGQAGRWQSFYHDVMVEHDKHVGQLLDQLDERAALPRGVLARGARRGRNHGEHAHPIAE